MKLPILSLVFFLFIGCSKENEFPEEFVGSWIFDIESLYQDIEERNLPQEEETALKYAFGAIEKNQTCTVTKKGIFRYPQLPKGVHIKLTVVSHSENGYLFKEQNSMNPSAPEYSLNRIENGIWEIISVTEDLEPINPQFPNTYRAKQPIVSK